jgi:hypothetical protein
VLLFPVASYVSKPAPFVAIVRHAQPATLAASTHTAYL